METRENYTSSKRESSSWFALKGEIKYNYSCTSSSSNDSKEMQTKRSRVPVLNVQSCYDVRDAVFVAIVMSKTYYYTSDSLWKIWLVESIQSIHNSLWTWHDKCNICCRHCIYHVKFNVCLVTKPLGVFSSETEWLNASLLFLRMNYFPVKDFSILMYILFTQRFIVF